MSMQHISEPMAEALETIRVKAMAQPQVWIAQGRFVMNRFSQRRVPVARARTQTVPEMIADALSRTDDIQFEFALRDLNHMLRAIREAEQTPPPSGADALEVPAERAAA